MPPTPAPARLERQMSDEARALLSHLHEPVDCVDRAASQQALRVLVRIRPAVHLAPVGLACSDDGQHVEVHEGGTGRASRSLSFGRVFDARATQSEVFEHAARPLVDVALSGINCTVLAYGQTGSGKTYTMMGAAHDTLGATVAGAGEAAPDGWGLVPRLLRALFGRIGELESPRRRDRATAADAKGRALCAFSVRASFVEVYAERLYDLLLSGSECGGEGEGKGEAEADETRTRRRRQQERVPWGGGGGRARDKGGFALRLFDDGAGGTGIPGATSVRVSSVAGALAALARGVARRITAVTRMNARSSRSHAVFLLTIAKHTLNGGSDEGDGDNPVACGHAPPLPPTPSVTTLRSQLFLVDLAGSEQVARTGATGERLSEACHINRSLLFLGIAIAQLASRQQQQQQQRGEEHGARAGAATPGAGAGAGTPHIPFRDSTLTRLLRNSLGGNARTLVCVTVSPAVENLSESLAALAFGRRAMRVRNDCRVNESAVVSRVELRRLQAALAATRGRVLRHLAGLRSANRLRDGYGQLMRCLAPTLERVRAEGRAEDEGEGEGGEPGDDRGGIERQDLDTVGGGGQASAAEPARPAAAVVAGITLQSLRAAAPALYARCTQLVAVARGNACRFEGGRAGGDSGDDSTTLDCVSPAAVAAASSTAKRLLAGKVAEWQRASFALERQLSAEEAAEAHAKAARARLEAGCGAAGAADDEASDSDSDSDGGDGSAGAEGSVECGNGDSGCNGGCVGAGGRAACGGDVRGRVRVVCRFRPPSAADVEHEAGDSPGDTGTSVQRAMAAIGRRLGFSAANRGTVVVARTQDGGGIAEPRVFQFDAVLPPAAPGRAPGAVECDADADADADADTTRVPAELTGAAAEQSRWQRDACHVVRTRHLAKAVARGHDALILAYGHTGSGKTHTMFGSGTVKGVAQQAVACLFARVDRMRRGGARRALVPAPAPAPAPAPELPAPLGTVVAASFRASFIEIYQERCFDLLSPGAGRHAAANEGPWRCACGAYNRAPPRDMDRCSSRACGAPKPGAPLQLMRGEHTFVRCAGTSCRGAGTTRPFCRCLWHPARSAAALEALIARGLAARATAGTSRNARSSRSHALLEVRVELALRGACACPLPPPLAPETDALGGVVLPCMHCSGRGATLRLVDLAGSERHDASADASAQAAGEQQRQHAEGSAINRSLLALGNVVEALARRSQGGAARGSAGRGAGRGGTYTHTHIPYRDSALTALLRPCFESAAALENTVLVLALSPSRAHEAETLKTLALGQRAYGIRAAAGSPSGSARAWSLLGDGAGGAGGEARAAAAANRLRLQLGALQRHDEQQRAVLGWRAVELASDRAAATRLLAHGVLETACARGILAAHPSLRRHLLRAQPAICTQLSTCTLATVLSLFTRPLDLGRLCCVCSLWRQALSVDWLWARAAKQLRPGGGTAITTRAAFVEWQQAEHEALQGHRRRVLERFQADADARQEAQSRSGGLSLLLSSTEYA
eukprot:g196.t1